MSQQEAPILIVGAGPSGLVAALALLKNGVRVRIIAKELKYRNGSRGAGAMPRTLEIMNLLGVLDDVQNNSAPVARMRSYKLPGGVEPVRTWDLMPPLDPSPSRPFTTVTELGQDVSERILRSHLEKHGVTVELGTEFLGLEQDSDGVTVRLRHHLEEPQREESTTFRYVLGADGARGLVRKVLGLPFVGETRDGDELIVGDVEVSNLSTDYWHFWINPASNSKTTMSLRPACPGQNRFAIFMVGQDLAQHNLTQADNFRDFFRRFTSREDIILGEFPWLSYFRPNMRMVDRFSEGRVFIMGDAAHVHSPTGGQGMNSSIQDAFNLAWKIALVEKGLAPESLLASYSEERLPVIAEMLRQTSKVHTRTFQRAQLKDGDEAAWTRGHALYMFGINYRWSPIVLEERCPQNQSFDELRALAYVAGGDNICAGDRAPEAPGLLLPGTDEETSLFKILTATQHTVLIFAHGDHARADSAVEAAARWPRELIQTVSIFRPSVEGVSSAGMNLVDRDGHAHGAYRVGANDYTIIIVRPDGVLGGIVCDAGGVGRYFTRIFSS